LPVDTRKTILVQESNLTVNQKDIYVECIQLTNQVRAKGAFSNFFVSALPLFIGWEQEVRFSNLFLLVLLWAYTIISTYFSYRFANSTPSPEKLYRWGKSLYFQVAFLGILYNTIFFNLHLHGIENSLLYLLLITALLSSGGTSSYQHMKGLGPCFAIFAMAPQVYYYLTQGDTKDQITAVLIVIFTGFTLSISINIYRNAVRFLRMNHELDMAKKNADKLARLDVLSGLGNRRAFFEQGQLLYNTSIRYGSSVTISMIDIDNFKSINDTYGHAAGDQIIKTLAKILQKGVRESDVVARIGGEEFAIVLPETAASAAYELIERLRSEINLNPSIVGEEKLTYSASFGIAEDNEKCASFEQLLSNADEALYRAKQTGKNKAVIFN